MPKIKIIMTALLAAGLFCSGLGGPQSKSPQPAAESSVAEKSEKISINTGRIIVIPSDTKELAKVLEDLKEPKAEEKQESKQRETDISSIFTNLKSDVSKYWRKVSAWNGFDIWKIIFLAIGIFITFIISRLARWFLEHFIAKKLAVKTKSDVDDLLCQVISGPVSMCCFSVGLYVSALPMLKSMPREIDEIAERICLAMAAAAIAWGIYRLITVLDYFLTQRATKTESNLDNLIINLIRKTLKVTVAVVSVLFIGQNILGLNITTLLAGAGVAGLAIAFAAKDTIANFFGSVMIILDKPFKVGDRIKLEGVDGTVENVGFRSTRIRLLDGHLVTMPNEKVANAAIENVTSRPFIKFFNNLTLVYDTPAGKVQRAVDILHEIYDNHDGMNEELPPRIYFSAFNDWSLNIMVIVWFHPGDYWLAQQWNHEKNMEILKRFNAEGLEFAFPTNTTYLAYDENREITMNMKSQNNAK